MATVKLQYFKPSGKWGYEGEFIASNDDSPYLIFDQIRAMNSAGELPGLSSGTWHGPIHCDLNDHPMAFPALLNLGGAQ